MSIPFVKMHALGNDFMVIESMTSAIAPNPAQIRQWGDRHAGVGFDQLLLLEPATSPEADFNYRIFNADGNEVEQCGNGARAMALFIKQQGLANKPRLRLATLRGIIETELCADNHVLVHMGVPKVAPTKTIQLNDTQTITGIPVDMGNPHFVLLVDNYETASVAAIGFALNHHPDFPQGVNVGFLQILDEHHAKLRVYERGVGETRACGSGACAAMAAGCFLQKLASSALIALSGGNLQLSWPSKAEPLTMKGPATFVFTGKIGL